MFRAARTLALVLALLLAIQSQGFAAAPARIGNCWVIAMAMNQDGPGAEDWSSYGTEFARVFAQHAKPVYRGVQVRTVLGPQAIMPNVVQAFTWMATNAKAGDLAVVYIGAHGGTHLKDGWSTGLMDGTTLYGRELKLLAARLPCVTLFVIDTCGSGGFAKPHERDLPLPAN